MKEEVELPPANQQVKRVKMYGTKDSQYHAPGELTMVDPTMVDHFKARGLSLTKPDDYEEPDEVSPVKTKGKTMLTADDMVTASLAKK